MKVPFTMVCLSGRSGFYMSVIVTPALFTYKKTQRHLLCKVDEKEFGVVSPPSILIAMR